MQHVSIQYLQSKDFITVTISKTLLNSKFTSLNTTFIQLRVFAIYKSDAMNQPLVVMTIVYVSKVQMAKPEICFTDLGRTYFNLDFSAFHIWGHP